MKIEESKVINILKQCFDPEIPIDLWSLGLIYDISISNNKVDITMSLTTPGCTMGDHMAEDIKLKLKAEGIINVNVNVVFDPPWEPGMMTDEAREKLGFAPSKKNNEPTNKTWE